MVLFIILNTSLPESQWMQHNQKKTSTQLAWAVEYTDCISTERSDSSNACPGEAPVILEI